MNKLVMRTKYKLADFIKDDFPLFIGKAGNSDHVLHAHDFTELVIVESGKGYHFTKTFRHRISSGDVLSIPRGLKHGYENTEELNITNITFDISLLDSFPDDLKHIPGFHSLFMMSHLQHKRAVNKKGFLTLRPEEISTVRQMTKRMANELQNRISGYKSVCVLTLADLIIFLSRKAARHNIASHSETLAETLCYMEKNYTENISLEKLSRIAGLSPRNFQRLFKNYMGLSPFNHLINIRLQHAKKLLEESALNISEIADATGFGDSAYFARQFKKTFRISPTEHRKQTRLADN